MAKPTRPDPFDINVPPERAAGSGSGVGDGFVGITGTTEVLVRGDPAGAPYVGWIINNPTGSGTITGSGPLTQVGSLNLYAAQLGVGIFVATPPGSANCFVWAQNDDTTTQGHPFRAVFSGSGSGILVAGAQQSGGIRHAKQPVPPAVQLRPDPPDCGERDGDPAPRIELTTLIFCALPGLGGSWLSEPVSRPAGSADPAFWQLRKHDARTWALLLRQRDTEVVVYRQQTVGEHDYSFPIQLQRTGAGGDSEAWPRTVTVVPAP